MISFKVIFHGPQGNHTNVRRISRTRNLYPPPPEFECGCDLSFSAFFCFPNVFELQMYLSFKSV